MADSDQQTTGGLGQGAAPSALKGLKILIAEDSPTQAFIIREALQEHGLTVTVTRDGVEALQAMQQELPDLVISDIRMPRMDGYEFCKRVKTDSRFKAVPVIILTNLADVMDAIKGIECGADSFMTKPYDIEVLLSTMNDVIETKKLQREPTPRRQLEFFFGERRHQLSVDQTQITELFLSTYAHAIRKNSELERAYRTLNLIHEELEKNNAELERLNQEKNQFIGMAAHDLRNPLGVITGYSQYLLEAFDEKLGAEAKKMLRRISDSSAYMLQLINDMLDISKIESGQVSLHKNSVDVVALLRETVALNSSMAEKKGIALQLTCEDGLPPLDCDRNKVEQIFDNLINNAIKYSYPGGQVQITLELKNKELVLAVHDHGIGVSPEAQSRLFQPFAKGVAKGTAGEVSTGLGLAIVKKIVNEHDGRMWVESTLGQGSSFFVALPA